MSTNGQHVVGASEGNCSWTSSHIASSATACSPVANCATACSPIASSSIASCAAASSAAVSSVVASTAKASSAGGGNAVASSSVASYSVVSSSSNKTVCKKSRPALVTNNVRRRHSNRNRYFEFALQEFHSTHCSGCRHPNRHGSKHD